MAHMADDQGSLPGQNEADDVDVSTVENDGPDSSAEGSDVSASSSEAKDADDNQALLAVVKQAVDKTRNDVDSSTTETKEGTAADAANDAATPDGTGADFVDEAGKPLPFGQHPRWKEVLAERDSYKGDATQYRTITGFMTEHELQPDEMAEGMLIMGLMKQSPQAALDRLKPHVARLEQFLGVALPADLQTQVDEGLTTPELARETAQLRLAQEHRTSQDERQAADNAVAQRQATVTGMKTAVDTWEQGARSRDPDFTKKSDFVADQTRLLISQRGFPKTPAEAVTLAKEAYETVNKRLGSVITPPAPTKKTPTGSRTSTPAAAAPSTLAEVVRNAARQGA